MAASSTHNFQPTVEDYHSDQSDDGRHAVRDTSASARNSSTPPAQANVSTKRSKDLNQEKAPAQEKLAANFDLRSDSGYSSYTGISKSSADSAPSATSRSPPVLPAAAAPMPTQSPAPKSRRPTGGDSRQHSNESSPRQRPSRTASVSSKQRPAAGQRRQTVTECTDPRCTECGPNALPQRRQPGVQRQPSTREPPQYPLDQRSVYTQSSDPNPPASPTYYRQPGPYAQGAAVIEPAQTRRRSSSVRPRPQSFAGDPSALLQAGYNSLGYPSPPHERGPPISNSAYANAPFMNMPYGVIPPFMPQPQPGGYYPSGPQAPAAFEQQRPPLASHGSSNYARRGPPPLITQSVEPKYSARYGPPTPVEPVMQRPPRRALLRNGEEDDSDSYSSDEEAPHEQYEPDPRDERRARAREAEVEAQRRARALMPPPSLKRDSSQRRPTLPHANTTQNIYPSERSRDGRRGSTFIVTERPAPRERERERERERDRVPRSSAAPPRRKSVSRPPMHRQSQSEYDTRSTRVIVNNSKKDRRQSYLTTETARDEYDRARAVEEQYNAERRREKRASRQFTMERHPMPGGFGDDDEEDEVEEAPPLRPALRTRRKTETSDIRKAKERPVEVKNKKAENAAEEYIKSTRGSRDPYADQINKAAKRASRMPSLPSDSGSSQSNGSGKASQSNRTTMTGTTNNEIRLRLQNGSAPVNLQISGDMEGRTLQLVPAENGATDLVIGNARGETSYQSERGTVMVNNRRSIVAGQGRRDLEEASERSSRTGRSRRDRSDEIRESRDDQEVRRHVLRRSRNTAYH